jgi:ribosome-associated protein
VDPFHLIKGKTVGAATLAKQAHKPRFLTPPSSLQLALAAAQVADDNHGRDIVILDMRKLTPIFDYFVIATGTSRRQLHAISEDIDDKLQDELGDHRMGIEGYQESRWIVLDYGSVVVHLFDADAREYYALEDLWAQAERVPFEPASALHLAETNGNLAARPR